VQIQQRLLRRLHLDIGWHHLHHHSIKHQIGKKHHLLIKTDGSQHLKDKLHRLHHLDMVVIDKEKPLINYLSEVFCIILL
jgi:hypothetical protein